MGREHVPIRRRRRRRVSRSVGREPEDQDGHLPSEVPRIVDLQRQAGNRAVVDHLFGRPRPVVQRNEPGERIVGRGRLTGATAAQAIHIALDGSPTERDVARVLDILSQLRVGEGAAVWNAYPGGRAGLRDALQQLGDRDRTRAYAYLTHGQLRLADQIALAVMGDTGTDEATLFRLLPRARDDRESVEADLEATYHTPLAADLSENGASQSRVAYLLRRELSGEALARGLALWAHGRLLPHDKVWVAFSGTGTNTALLFEGLREGGSSLLRDFEELYGEPLVPALDNEVGLAPNDRMRALALLTERFDPEAAIRIATAGPGTDEDAIFAILGRLTAESRQRLLGQWRRGQPVYDDLRSELDDEDFARAAALLRGGDSGESRLAQAGATDADDAFDRIRMARGSELAQYRADWNEGAAYLRVRLYDEWSMAQRMAVDIYLNGTAAARLRHATSGASDDEEYVLHLAEHVLTESERRDVVNDRTLMSRLESRLSPTDWRRVRDLLQRGFGTLEEQIERQGERIGEEQSFLGDRTREAEALHDEHRALEGARSRAADDFVATPREQAILTGHLTETESALTAYRGARDELESVASTVTNVAVGVLASVLTAGLAAGPTIAMLTSELAVHVARTALIHGVLNVAAQEAIRGDRFDVAGSEGAIAFGSGALDGVVSVFSGGLAQRVINPEFRRAVTTAARVEAMSNWGQRGAGYRLGQRAVEGAATGSVTGFFEAAANDQTWNDGFSRALERIAASMGQAVLMEWAEEVALEGIEIGADWMYRRARADQPDLGSSGSATPDAVRAPEQRRETAEPAGQPSRDASESRSRTEEPSSPSSPTVEPGRRPGRAAPPSASAERVNRGVARLLMDWGGLDPGGRESALGRIINQLLRDKGVPVPISFVCDGAGFDGRFYPRDWLIVLERGFIDSETLTPHQISMLVETIRHEVHHAEQAWHVAMMLRHRGLTADKIAEAMRLNDDARVMANAASEEADRFRPDRPPYDPRSAQWYESGWGRGRSETERITALADEAADEVARLRGDIVRRVNQANARLAELDRPDLEPHERDERDRIRRETRHLVEVGRTLNRLSYQLTRPELSRYENLAIEASAHAEGRLARREVAAVARAQRRWLNLVELHKEALERHNRAPTEETLRQYLRAQQAMDRAYRRIGELAGNDHGSDNSD